MFDNIPYQFTEFVGHSVSYCVGDIDRHGTCVNDFSKDTAQVIPVAPCGVHRGEFNVMRVFFCPLNGTDGNLQDFIS